jgi:hypothetical protein
MTIVARCEPACNHSLDAPMSVIPVFVGDFLHRQTADEHGWTDDIDSFDRFRANVVEKFFRAG